MALEHEAKECNDITLTEREDAVRTLKGCLVGAVSLLPLTGGAGGSVVAAEVRVVASIKPLHSLVAGVMQDVAAPVLLVKGAGSPHTYSLRPSEARALAAADVVFWVGAGLEAFLVKPVHALAGNAEVLALSEAPGVHLLATREGGMWEAHEHDDHAEQHVGNHDAEHERGEEHGHAHGQFDMHVWLDPRNAEAMVGAIVATLSDADPDNAATYQSNGDSLRQRLQDLHQSLTTGLEPVRDRPFVVFHDAYHYFENRYGLNAVGSIAVDPGRRPGAQRLAEIQHRLEELDAACVFAEPQFEPALVDTVIEGTSARKGVLDPLGASLDDGPDQYFQLMNGLAASLVGCLGPARSG
jgi:zinc transport system substrate-binding protein